VEEFFPDEFDGAATGNLEGGISNAGVGHSAQPPNRIKPGLADKLNQKAARINGHGAAVSIHQPSYQVQHGRA
jgi:hypothetical protein